MVYLNELPTGHCFASVEKVVPIHDGGVVGRTDTANIDGGGWGCARAYMLVCMRACVHDLFAVYDNNILPRLIMIILKIISLYFIEIAQTDDFPSKGTHPASKYNYASVLPRFSKGQGVI